MSETKRSEYLVRAVRESQFFKAVAHEEKVSLAELGEVRNHDEGVVLFRPGQKPAALYLVLEGVLEICRQETTDGELHPVVYLGRGAVIAESKVITGTPFGSLARFPEGGATLEWPRPVILRKLYEAREFAMQYLHNLALRLEGTFANMGGQGGRELSGSLDRFDLPAILQTVVESGASGVLEISDAQGHRFGTIYISERLLGQMRCGSLTGADAFLEIMLSMPDKGTFQFKSVGRTPDTAQRYPLQSLLLEAARLADEMRRLSRDVPDDVPLQLASRQLELTGVGRAELTEMVWQELSAEPRSWGALAERLGRSRGEVALVVREMIDAGLLTKSC